MQQLTFNEREERRVLPKATVKNFISVNLVELIEAKHKMTEPTVEC